MDLLEFSDAQLIMVKSALQKEKDIKHVANYLNTDLSLLNLMKKMSTYLSDTEFITTIRSNSLPAMKLTHKELQAIRGGFAFLCLLGYYVGKLGEKIKDNL